MTLAVLGTGRFGGQLVRALARAGHRVLAGTRSPLKSENQSLSQDTGAPLLSLSGAAAQAEVVFLALPWTETLGVLRGLDLRGKIVVDCTNPIDRSGLTLGPGTSAGEEVAKACPGARVVKGFNGVGSELLLDPVVEGQAAHVLLASDDRPAMGVVAGIAQSLGFEAQEAGALENARLLEALALLWIRLSFQAGLGPRVALRVLRP